MITGQISPATGGGQTAGPPGLSAFDLWVRAGNSGNLAAFLASLQGPAGPAGAASVVPGPPGSQGPAGPAAWAPAVAWSVGLVCVSAAPSTVVTYGGETYVCIVPHNAYIFANDLAAGRWLKIAQMGATGATGATGPQGPQGATGATGATGPAGPAVGGALLYTSSQSLTTGNITQVRQNARLPGSGFAYDPSDSVQLTPAAIGTLLFYDVSRTVYLPQLTLSAIGDEIEFFVRPGTSLTLKSYPSDSYPNVGTIFGDNPSAVLTSGTYTVIRHDSCWRVHGSGVNEVTTLMVDRAQPFFTDANRQNIYNNADITIPCGQCRLVYNSASQISLMPFDGNRIFINGNYRTIPSGGVQVSNSGLVTNNVYYAYAYWTGSAIAMVLNTSGYQIDPGFGHRIFGAGSTLASNRYYTYVGMVFIDGSGGFKDTALTRYVLSHYNKRPRALTGTATSASTSSTSQTELSTNFRVYFICEAGDTVTGQAFGNGGTNNSQPGFPMYMGISLDNADGPPTGLSSTPAYGSGTLASGYTWEPAEGFHYLTVRASTPQTGMGAGTFNGATSGVVMC